MRKNTNGPLFHVRATVKFKAELLPRKVIPLNFEINEVGKFPLAQDREQQRVVLPLLTAFDMDCAQAARMGFEERSEKRGMIEFPDRIGFPDVMLSSRTKVFPLGGNNNENIKELGA